MTHHHFKTRTWSAAGTFTVVGAAMTDTPSGIAYNTSDAKYYTNGGAAASNANSVSRIAADGSGQTRFNAGTANRSGGLAEIMVDASGNLFYFSYLDDTVSTGPSLQRMTTAGVFITDDNPQALSAGIPAYGGGPVLGPTGDTSSVYGSAGGVLLARWDISAFASTTTRAWFATANSPFFVCLGPDNLIWTLGQGASAPTRVLVHWNAATSTTAPTAAGTVAVTATGLTRKILSGPDGNIWILYNDRFVVYSTATTPVLLSTFVFTTTTGTARDACAGPDSAMWASVGGATNRLVRCTTAGAITEYAITTDTSPWGICAGADNASVWFVSQTTKKFIKFT